MKIRLEIDGCKIEKEIQDTSRGLILPYKEFPFKKDHEVI
jgi:hypothetical protein